MASQAALILRVMASSIAVANRAGKIIRDVMSKGDLGIVEKVSRVHHFHPVPLKSLAIQFNQFHDHHPFV